MPRKVSQFPSYFCKSQVKVPHLVDGGVLSFQSFFFGLSFVTNIEGGKSSAFSPFRVPQHRVNSG